MKLFYFLPGLAAVTIMPKLVIAASPQGPIIDVAAFKSDAALNALFTDLGAAINKPASEIQQHTLTALSTPAMRALIEKLYDQPSTKHDIEAQDLLDAVFMAAVATSIEEMKKKGGKRSQNGKNEEINIR